MPRLQHLPALQASRPLLVHRGHQRASSRSLRCRHGSATSRPRLSNQPHDRRSVTQLRKFPFFRLARGTHLLRVRIDIQLFCVQTH